MSNSFQIILIQFLIILTSTIHQSSGTCGKETKEFMKCWKNLQDNLSSKRTADNITKQEFNDKVSHCFTLNGCKTIQLQTKEERKSGLGDKAKSCLTEIQKSSKRSLEICVQNGLDKNFAFPDSKTNFTHVDPNDAGWRTPMELTSMTHQIMPKTFDESICPKGANMSGLYSCISELFNQISINDACKNEFLSKIEHENQLAELCKPNCFSKLTSKCVDTVNVTYALMKDCAAKETASPGKTLDGHIAEYKKCVVSKGAANVDPSSLVVEAIVQMTSTVVDDQPIDPCTDSWLNDGKNNYKPQMLPLPAKI